MKPIVNGFRSRCAGAFIPALLALHMAMPCSGQWIEPMDLLWMQQQNQFNNQMQMAMANIQAQAQAFVAKAQAKEAARTQYREMFSELTAAGKRAEYQKFRQEVETYVRSGNAEGLYDLIHVKAEPIKENAAVIGGDCAQLMSYCDNFNAEVGRRMFMQMVNQSMMQEQSMQQMMNNNSRPKMHEFKCYRCGTTYVGRFSCPNCSGPKYY